MSVERISVDEALSRGYEWIRIGWNHGQNQPILAQIRMIRPCIWGGLSVDALEAAKAIVEGRR
jgi:hypothetical protein